MVHTMLSEFLNPKWEISTPFPALLGRIPITVYAVLERTAVYQVIGEDHRKLVRHDFIFVDERKLRMRPIDEGILKQRESRERGRLNRLLAKEILKL
jgi:hypothetical protein